MDSCFEFMGTARARRKIIVIGTLADCGTGAPQKYEQVARRAQLIADHTVFVGPWATNVLKARKPGESEALRAFSHVREAAEICQFNRSRGGSRFAQRHQQAGSLAAHHSDANRQRGLLARRLQPVFIL